MDKDFIDSIQRMIEKEGKEVLVNGNVRAFLKDYCNAQFKKEINFFLQILDADCGQYINNADDVLERKQKLMTRLEDEYNLSPKKTAEYLDLLGLILKGDTSKCGEAASSPPPPSATDNVGSHMINPTRDIFKVTLKNIVLASEAYGRGKMYFEKHDYNNAVNELNNSINFRPTDSPAYALRGEVYCMMGRINEAFSDLNEAIRLDQNNSSAYASRGSLYKQMGRINEAFSDLNEAIRLSPNNSPVYVSRGLIYHQIGRYVEAITDYNEAIKLSPNYSLAYAARGKCYLQFGQNNEAFRDFCAAIKFDSYCITAYVNRGKLYMQAGQRDPAIQDFEIALRLNPNDVNVRQMLLALRGY